MRRTLPHPRKLFMSIASLQHSDKLFFMSNCFTTHVQHSKELEFILRRDSVLIICFWIHWQFATWWGGVCLKSLWKKYISNSIESSQIVQSNRNSDQWTSLFLEGIQKWAKLLIRYINNADVYILLIFRHIKYIFSFSARIK